MSDWAITHAELLSLLHYDPSTGIWTWRAKSSTGRNVAGKRADLGYGGYRRISIIKVERKKFKGLSHRLAWFYMTGEWPSNDVDHKDRNKNNNCWKNLRCATRAQNMANASRPSHNTSGFKGVNCVKKQANRWRAYITLNRKQINLGFFDCPAAAHFAYVVAADKIYGEFANADTERPV